MPPSVGSWLDRYGLLSSLGAGGVWKVYLARNIRGTEPRLNSMMINGERVPSPDGELRSVAADVIPADFLQSIELTKALTPDMDADAIGGAVNLVMKQAPQEPTVLATLGGGHNSTMGDSGQGKGGEQQLDDDVDTEDGVCPERSGAQAFEDNALTVDGDNRDQRRC